MTQEQKNRIIEIYGKDYSQSDVPPQLREENIIPTLNKITESYKEEMDWAEMHGITQDQETGEWN